MNSLHIDSKVEEPPEKELVEDATIDLRMVKSAYEVNFTGLKKPVKVDCNQEGVICKFPLTEPKGEPKVTITRQPSEKTEEVPIYSGVSVPSEDDVNIDVKNKKEGKISLVTRREDNLEHSKTVPVFKGTVDVESLFSDGKNIHPISENHIPDKDPVNVYVRRYPNNHMPSVYFMYHSPYDVHDHIGTGPYQHYPLAQPSYRWNPFLRPEPARQPHIVTNTPCDPPVYNYQPPPCSHVRPTNKPVINIDDKIDN